MKALLVESQVPAGEPVASRIRLIEDWPEPGDPGVGEALLAVEYSALNHLDLWVGRGVPGLKLEYPRISGCDACARVLAVGPGSDPSWVGRRVILNAAVATPRSAHPANSSRAGAPQYELIGEHHDGTHRERFLAPLVNLAVIPDEVDGAEAAAFGLTSLTAWSMMVGKARLTPGERVLITGIGGGVATAALAIARHHACETIVTSRHAWKLERARAELGADHAILDDGGDWTRTVRTLTGGFGVDLAVDTSGKATHLRALRALAPGGRYVSAGSTSGPDATTDLARIFWNQLSILGSTMGTPEEFASVAALFAEGKLRPVVDALVEIEEAPAAWAKLEEGSQMGKLVLRWPAATEAS